MYDRIIFTPIKKSRGLYGFMFYDNEYSSLELQYLKGPTSLKRLFLYSIFWFLVITGIFFFVVPLGLILIIFHLCYYLASVFASKLFIYFNCFHCFPCCPRTR